ncbi:MULTISPECIES: ABC transporter substrate-binding protein [unclassified Paenibacillus]|uniref:ABC transporter substrate-binding protein n=1 Tax=unclassified Paenibacillus TaxID=185978 RepID=UPI0009541BF5|nr:MULTISPECIES: ABC transporter substrate-binding protein [unclassified Paenibacillus]ASS65442.1 hypothetical protein CIC07_04360 [Paenibacillus sp. RUD330]SIQ36113.1 DNA-binding transcriptional regulator SgrR of sgrS sRNA, contains a MarR-type HTH domain and a solute-binding domain [Paenibacillus sp. RU4X]SIQ58123.1 DNA-binding transcriptional regulator SgrR of sgrS sRNA, contains a MarR-type HTH domain and a solute-binding domain [Paenibacillus sp. RU4T]
MIETERYLILYDKYSTGSPLGTPIEVALEELAEALRCTTRNVKLILKKLEDDHCLGWLPGRGRGHRSRLVFKQDRDRLLLEACKTEASQGNYRIALELVNRFGNGTSAKDEFMGWLGGSFGVRKETVEGQVCCDTLRFPVYRNVYTLDPAEVEFAFDSHLIHHIFDGLVAYDESSERIVPGLAHAWNVNSEGTEWTFYLRKGVHFHDGRELTSQDALFTFERLRQSRSSNAWLMRNVASIEALGRRTIRFRLAKPNRIFDRFLSSSIASVLPAGFSAMDESSYWRLPAGTGAFRLESRTPQKIVLTANESYYAERPYLDRVEILVFAEEMEQPSTIGLPDIMPLAMDSGVHPPPQEDWQSLARLYNGCTMLTWNGKRDGWVRSGDLRKAVRLMLDPVAMQAELGGERAMPAYRLRPQDSVNHLPRTAPESEVRGLMARSGYDGTPLRLLAHEKYRKDSKWIASRLGKFGINVELVVADWMQLVDEAIIAGADMALSGMFLSDEYVCEIDMYEHGGGIVSLYTDDQKGWMLERIDAALASYSEEERYSHLRAVELRLLEESRIVFLHHRRLNTFVHPTIRGAAFNARGWIDFKRIWLEEQ